VSGLRLGRRLTLEALAQTPDGTGGMTESWVPLGEVWAALRAGTGKEKALDFASVSRVPYRIIIRHVPYGAPSRPCAGQRFSDGTRVFAILAVADAMADGRYLTCFAHEEVAG